MAVPCILVDGRNLPLTERYLNWITIPEPITTPTFALFFTRVPTSVTVIKMGLNNLPPEHLFEFFFCFL